VDVAFSPHGIALCFTKLHFYCEVYRVIQEKKSVLWEVIILVIVRKTFL